MGIQRRDGLQTKKKILSVAIRVFAERGYSDTTSKDICKAADTNVASVNYYFRNKDGLYEEVLIEAHKQLVDLDELEETAKENATPEEKLRKTLSQVISAARNPSKQPSIKVIFRELASPSIFAENALVPAILPKAAIARKLVADVIGKPVDAPEVQRALVLAILPVFSMIMFPETLKSKILPAAGRQSAEMQEDMMKYIFAGLKALSGKN